MIKKFLLLLLFFFFSTPVFAQTDVIGEVFSTLNQDYVNDVQNKDIALKGLQALSSADKNLTLTPKDNTLVLTYPSKEPQTFAFPDKDDISSWSAFCKNVIRQACQTSEKLETIDFELEDRFAAAVLENLDGYSHYFSVFSDETEDKPFKIKRPFASRVVDSILLIRVLTFKKDISQNVKDAVLECSKCKGIILDLRGNHGGFLNEAINIADMFLDEGI